MRRLFLILAAMAASGRAADIFELQLSKAETAALEASNLLKAAQSELRAADERGDQGFSLLWPRLSLDASDRYSTVVPELSLAPNQPKRKFGDNNVYSVGVGAVWTFWDSGNAYNLYRGAAALREAKAAELEARRREIRLRARLSYFQTQLMAERARLLADSLRLSQSQAKDIELRLKAGASSRIDALASQNDVLVRRGQYRAARADL